MYSPWLHPENIPTDYSGILVIAVPETQEIQFIDPASGEETHPSLLLSDRNRVEEVSGRLASLNIRFGERAFTDDDLPGDPRFGARALGNTLRIIRNRLPPEVLMSFDAPTGNAYLFGQFAVMSRRASEDELETYHAKMRDQSASRLRELHEEAWNTEAEKTDLTGYDHAILGLKNKTYQLDLGTPEAMMATRVMLVLGLPMVQARKFQQAIDQRKVAQAVWADMPLNERQLYANNDADLYKQPPAVLRAVQSTLSSLTSLLEVTQRSNLPTNYYRLVTSAINVSLEIAPPLAPYSGVYKIFPPGTPRLRVALETAQHVSEEQLEHARQLIDQSETGEPCKSQNEAIRMLDTIMHPDGKLAMRLALAQRPEMQDVPLTAILARMHKMSLSALGYYQ